VGAIGRAPLDLIQAAATLKGKSITDEDAFKQAADTTMDNAAAFAVDNTGSTLEYRCMMISVLVNQALSSAAQAIENG